MKDLRKSTNREVDDITNEKEEFDIDNFYGYADDISYESNQEFINDVQHDWEEERDQL